MTFEQFKREWVRYFAGDVPVDEVEKYILCHGLAWNFIWHAFSWELVPEGAYLMGAAARRAFDEQNKDSAIAIDPFEDNPKTVSLTDGLRHAAAIEELTEIYIVGKDFAWTYIKTHEGGLGPYFCTKRTDSVENYDEAARRRDVNDRRLEAAEASRKVRGRRLSLAIGIGLAVAAGVAAFFFFK